MPVTRLRESQGRREQVPKASMVLSRVRRVVFGAWDEKAGMAGSVGDLLRHPRLNHTPEVQAGVLAEECAQMLTEFFESRRVSTS